MDKDGENNTKLLENKPKNKVKSTSSVVKLTEDGHEIAYTINDKYFTGFEVEKSANAWWMERGKVEALIQCFKQGYNVKQSCVYANISPDQYKYFLQKHPGFSTVKEYCEEVCKMMAETAIFRDLQSGKGDMVRWYAERRIPEKYGKHLAEEPNAITQNNFNTVIQVRPSVAKLIREHEEKEQREREQAIASDTTESTPSPTQSC